MNSHETPDLIINIVPDLPLLLDFLTSIANCACVFCWSLLTCSSGSGEGGGGESVGCEGGRRKGQEEERMKEGYKV